MDPEIPQQNSQNKPETQKITLSPEQQIQLQKEKEQVLIISKAQRGVLSNEAIVNYIQKFHDVDISKYSQDIQQKFIEEIQMIFSDFKDFDESMITKLREIRENMSVGMEKGKNNEYYRNMILGNKINTKVILLQESLRTINGEKIKIGNTEYNKKDYLEFKEQTIKLDQTHGIDIFSKINFEEYNQNYKQLFAQEIKKQIDSSNPKYNLIMNDLTRLPQIIGEKGFENLKQIKLKNGQIVNLEELFQEYNKNYKEFKTKNRVFEFGNKQMKTSQKGFGFGFEEKKYGIGYDELKDVYKEKLGDIEKMGTADLVIMMRVLFSIVPGIGDVVGGYDDGKQALAGVNFDGTLQGVGENMFGYFTGVLGVTIVGGGLAKIAKGPKLAKAMIKLGQIIEKLSKSNGLVELGKNEKVMKMLEMMKGIIPKVEGLLEKIKNGENTGIQKVAEVFPKFSTKEILKGKKIDLYDKNYVELLNSTLPEKLKITTQHIEAFEKLNHNLKLNGYENYLLSQENFIKWVTGNYNPDTGKITLYRYVNEDAINPILKYKGVISRAVDNFGNGDIKIAIENFGNLSKGIITPEMKNLFGKFIYDIQKNLYTGPEQERMLSTLEKYVQIYNGKIPDDLKKYYGEQYQILIKQFKKDNFLQDVIKESNGSTPINHEYKITHSLIYWTTLERPFGDLVNNRKFKIITEMDLSEAYPTGTVMNNNWIGIISPIELEWTNFGAIYQHNGNKIFIENIQTGEKFEIKQ